MKGGREIRGAESRTWKRNIGVHRSWIGKIGLRGNRNDFGGKVCCSPSRPLSGILSRGVHTCVNAQFTKHSVQLRSLPCQRVSSYVFQIYTGASSLHVFLDLSLELTPPTSPPFFSSSKSKFFQGRGREEDGASDTSQSLSENALVHQISWNFHEGMVSSSNEKIISAALLWFTAVTFKQISNFKSRLKFK